MILPCIADLDLMGQFRDAAKDKDENALLKIMSNYGMHCNEEYTYLFKL